MKLYKKSFKGIALAAFSVLALSACSDWTDSESIKLKEPGIDEQSPELYAKYLKNLQEYKNSDHKIYTAGLIIVRKFLSAAGSTCRMFPTAWT